MLTIPRKCFAWFVGNHLKRTGCSALNVMNGLTPIAPTGTIIMCAITVMTLTRRRVGPGPNVGLY